MSNRAEVLACALPWQPLAWWARHRLGQLSELACDDWVLATGLSATDYAESLLNLVPQRRGALALTAVSSRRGLFGRIAHILGERRSSPVVGARWACLSAMAMILAASVLALAQSRPADSKDHGPELTVHTKTTQLSNAAPANLKETTMRRTIRGTVVGPDGKPVSNATILWIGHRTPPLPVLALPKDRDSSRSNWSEVLASAQTGADGAFSLSADYDRDRYQRHTGSDATLLVKAPEAGMLPIAVKTDTADVNLRLAPEVVIHGRLLTPGGMPASGVRVALDSFYNDQAQEGMHVGLKPTDEEIPAYWPRSPRTDADGRFTLEGVPQGSYAKLTFWHPDYAVDEVTVDTTVDGSLTPRLRAFEITPVQATFTVGSSRVDLQACKLEYSIVSPK